MSRSLRCIACWTKLCTRSTTVFGAAPPNTLRRSLRPQISKFNAKEVRGETLTDSGRSKWYILYSLQNSIPNGYSIRMDIHENPETSRVTATFELPGLRNDDVRISIDRNRLVISGEVNFAQDREEGLFAVRECNRGRFSRSLPLPQGIRVS